MDDSLLALDRLRGSLLPASGKSVKGKHQDVTGIQAGLQEALGLIGCNNQGLDVVVQGLRLLEDILSSVQQAAMMVRLEGGFKIIAKLLRTCLADGQVIAVVGRVLTKCIATSALNQQTLAKEKMACSALLTALTAHCRDASVAPALADLAVALSRVARGAAGLAGEQMVVVTRDCFVNFMGNWPVIGLFVKAIKLQSKFDASAEALMRVGNGEVSRMLLGLARLLSRVPSQRKLLKRTSRALWLLHSSVLPPFPSLEPLVPLPPRDAQHLALASAMDCNDSQRLMELVPEEFCSELLPQQAQQAAELSPSPPDDETPTGSSAFASSSCWHADTTRKARLVRGSGSKGMASGTAATVDAHSPSVSGQSSNTCNAGVAGDQAVNVFRPSSDSSQGSRPGTGPPTAAQLCSRIASVGTYHSEPFHTYGDSLYPDMIMHDLRRLAFPGTVINRTVYMSSTAPATRNSSCTGDDNNCGTKSSSPFQTQAADAPPQPPPLHPNPGVNTRSGLRSGSASSTSSNATTTSSFVGSSASSASSTTYHDLFLSAAVNSGEVLQPMRRGTAWPEAGKQQIPSPDVSSTVPPLTFDSNFESGNLRSAVQVYANEYDLFLAPDLNDRSDGGNLCQWFYFKVSGMQPGVPYKFNLVNLRKKQSLFATGKQPVVCKAAAPAADDTRANTLQQDGMDYRNDSARLQKALTAFASTSQSTPYPGNAAPSTGSAASGTPSRASSTPVRQKDTKNRPSTSLAEKKVQLPNGVDACAVVDASCEGWWARAGADVAYYPSPYRGRKIPASGSGSGAPGTDASTTTKTKAVRKVNKSGGKQTKPGQLVASTLTATTSDSSSKKDSTSGVVSGPCGKSVNTCSNASCTDQGVAVGPGLYCCTFTLLVQQPGDYYVASCYPYTYTDLQEFLNGLIDKLHPLPAPSHQPDTPLQHSTDQGIIASSSVPDASAGSLGPTDSDSADAFATQAITRNTASATSASSTSRPKSGANQPTTTTPPSMIAAGMLARSTLCYSLCGHAADLITITDFAAPSEAVAQREVVAITARVHPGETCASWIMQGLVQFLTSSDADAALLRSAFVFKIIPMLNCDGVVNGSYRCSLAGCDLNRVWEKPSKDAHPVVYHTKKLLQALASGGVGRLALYIDIHGHSNKEDAFFYGCEPNLSGISNTANIVPAQPAQAATAAAASSSNSSKLPAALPGRSSDVEALPNSTCSTGALLGAMQIIGYGGSGGGAGSCGGRSDCSASQMTPTASQQLITMASGSSAAGIAGPVAGAGAGSSAGAGQQQQPQPQQSSTISARAAARLRVRLLPYLLSKVSNSWSYDRSNFRIRKAKLGAARVVIHREMGCAGAYTLEASLGGCSATKTHFSVEDYLRMGHELGKGIAALAQSDDLALLEHMAATITLPPYVSTYTV